MKNNTTRKKRINNIANNTSMKIPLYKMNYGRGLKERENIKLRGFCEARKGDTPAAWLILKESLQVPEQNTMQYNNDNFQFVHVIRGVMKDKDIVVKIQQDGRLIDRELAITRFLKEKGQNNIVEYYCDIGCNDNMIEWLNPIVNVTKPFCMGGDDRFHLIIMEYVKYRLTEYLSKHDYTLEVLKACIKQLIFTLCELHINYNISHGDIKSGNILVRIYKEKINKYKIFNKEYSVDTLGYEPVFIDFQRGHMANIPFNLNKHLFMLTDEITMLLDMFLRWCKFKDWISSINEQFLEVSNKKELIRVLDSL